MKNSDNRTENSEIFKNAPKTEPERQYYFIEQLKKIVEKKRDELGAYPQVLLRYLRLSDERQGF